MKYRKNPESKNPEAVKTKNRRLMISSNWFHKSVIKEQEASRLSSSLRIKTPLSKIPLVGPIPANTCWSSRRLADVLKTCLEDVFKTSWRQTKCLLMISVSNKSKYVSNKSMFHKSISDKSKANPKCLLRTQ